MAAMLLPALQSAREKAKLARWFVHRNSLLCDDGLIAYYTFEKGKGTKLENKAVGSPMETGYAAEKLDGTIYVEDWKENGGRWTGKYALYFDGSSAYVDCGNNSSFDIIGAITIEAWVKIFDKTDNAGFVYKGSFADESGPYDFWQNSDQFALAINHPGGLVSDTIPENDKWYHIVGTYDKNIASENLKLYVDGVLKDTDDYTTAIATNAHDLLIGAYWSPSYTFNGTIDEVAIYNRVLSTSEINAHYEMGKP